MLTDAALHLRDPAVEAGYSRPRTGLPQGQAAPFRDWKVPEIFRCADRAAPESPRTLAEPPPRIPFGATSGAAITKGVNGDIEVQRTPRPRRATAALRITALLAADRLARPGAGRTAADIARQTGASQGRVAHLIAPEGALSHLERRRLVSETHSAITLMEYRAPQDGTPWAPPSDGWRLARPGGVR